MKEDFTYRFYYLAVLTYLFYPFIYPVHQKRYPSAGFAGAGKIKISIAGLSTSEE